MQLTLHMLDKGEERKGEGQRGGGSSLHNEKASFLDLIRFKLPIQNKFFKK